MLQGHEMSDGQKGLGLAKKPHFVEVAHGLPSCRAIHSIST